MQEEKIIVILGNKPRLSSELIVQLEKKIGLPVEQVESLIEQTRLSTEDINLITKIECRSKKDFKDVVSATTKKYRSKSDRKRNKRDRWI